MPFVDDGRCWANSARKIEWREDLEILLRARFEVVLMRVGKGSTSLLLGFVDNLSSIGYLDQSRQTERAGDMISNQAALGHPPSNR